MKVRILSGNNAGAVVEMDRTEAENAIDTGYAKAVEVVPMIEAHPAEVAVIEPRRASRADLRRKAADTEDPSGVE